MAVPDFQSIMYPFLQVIADGKVYTLDEMVEKLKNHFQLTPEDLLLKTPSGQQQLFRNRIGWTRTYLDKAGLISRPTRGQYTITPLGIQALQQATAKYINISFLRRFAPFVEWESSYANGNATTNSSDSTETETDTPDIVIEEQVQKIHKNLKYELLNLLKEKPADFFEYFVTDLLSKMGYGGVSHNFEVVGRSSDGGIDGIVYQDHLHLEKVFVQAKRYKDNKVGAPEIRDFIGALSLQGTTKGVFMTTSDFTDEAVETSLRNPHNKIVLINGKRLTALALEFNVGVQVEKAIEIKGIDNDYFE